MLGFRNDIFMRPWLNVRPSFFHAQPWRSQPSLRSTTRPLMRLWVEVLDPESGRLTALEARACHWTCWGSSRTESRAERQWSHLRKSSNQLRKWSCSRKTTRQGWERTSWENNKNNSEVRNPLHLLVDFFVNNMVVINLWSTPKFETFTRCFLSDCMWITLNLIQKVLSHLFLMQSKIKDYFVHINCL